jgi:hypothetical protein
MTTAKMAGIWMDHASAHLIECNDGAAATKTILSAFTHQQKEHSLGKSENLMHNKEQHVEADFYKQIGELIKNYDEVLLFGPTKAKLELLNILKEDHRFSQIKIETKQADKMTENQQHAFVKDYFSRATLS